MAKPHYAFSMHAVPSKDFASSTLVFAGKDDTKTEIVIDSDNLPMIIEVLAGLNHHADSARNGTKLASFVVRSLRASKRQGDHLLFQVEFGEIGLLSFAVPHDQVAEFARRSDLLAQESQAKKH